MKRSMLKRGLAGAVALVLCALSACSPTVAETLYESRGESAMLTSPTRPVENTLADPPYYIPDSTDRNTAYTPENQLALLADRNFEGGYFLVVQEEGLENAIFPNSDELVSIYADRRNRLIQEKYNVQLASREMTADEIISELTENAKDELYFCDLLVVSPSLLKELQDRELIVSLDSLPFFETDSVCISAQATAELNADWEGIYGIWGDVLRQPTRQFCIYFNESLAQSIDNGNFYASVRSGNWDFDQMLTAAEQAIASGISGGISCDQSVSDLLLAASGISSASEEGRTLLESEAHLELIARFEALLLPNEPEIEENEGEEPLPEGDETAEGSLEEGEANDQAGAGNLEEGEGDESFLTDDYSRFVSGQALFYVGTLNELESFAHTDSVIGLLPMPKYSADDRDYPSITDQSNLPVLACPMYVSSAAGTGIMLSALNAASCDEINDVFIQNAEHYVRTNGSFLMLPFLFGEPRFDRKLIFG